MIKNDQQKKDIVVAFDFDGTLTTTDTLIEFIRFTHGLRRLLWGLLTNAHLLLMMKLGLYPNWKAKEKVFTHFYKGTAYKQFTLWGRDFADVAETMLNKQMVDTLKRHLAEEHTVCVITASIKEWVQPICNRLGINIILATRIEVSPNGILTGHFLTPNCHGTQKVTRLLEAFPQRQSYKLYVYGDSSGDNELLALADTGFRVNHYKSY